MKVEPGCARMRSKALVRCELASCIEICYLAKALRFVVRSGVPVSRRIPWFVSSYLESERHPMMTDRRQPLRGAAIRTLSRLTAIVTAGALALAPVAVPAQENKSPRLLRDTEIEQLLRDYTRPILRVAGLEQQNIQVVIISDPTFNAFVADGHRIFVNYGALMQSQTPNQLIGVLAHETGHLAGGHLAKLREELARAQTGMIVAMPSVSAPWSRAPEQQPNNGAGNTAPRRPRRTCPAEHPASPTSASEERECRPRRRQVFDRHRYRRRAAVRDLQAVQQ